MPIGLLMTMTLTMLLLFGFLFGLLAGVGYYAGISGYTIVVLAFIMVLFQWLIGPKVIWWTTNMRLLERNEYPWLRKTVEDLCRKNNTPMPQLAIANIGAPNAFVFGRTPGSATLTVTNGLLKTLTQDEVKAVVAHEVGHIKHWDMVVMTLASVVPIIAYFVARFLIFAPKDRDRKIGSAILVGLAAYLVYMVSNLLVLWLSRLREYYSDNFAGKNIKPSLLASALAKITYGLGMSNERSENLAVRSFYIADPIGSVGEISHFSSEYSDMHISSDEVEKAMEWERKNPYARFMELFKTHPLTFKRIRALHKLEKEIS